MILILLIPLLCTLLFSFIQYKRGAVDSGFVVYTLIVGLLFLSFATVPFLSAEHATNSTSKVRTEVKTEAPRATITKTYSKNEIKDVKQINSTQYLVTLNNGKTLAANVDLSHPTTKQQMQAPRPFVVESNYLTTYRHPLGFIRLKTNHNILIYLNK
jgi:hypothetical protein